MDKIYSCSECNAPIKIMGLTGLEKIALTESTDTKSEPTIINYYSKEKVKCLYCRSPIKI